MLTTKKNTPFAQERNLGPVVLSVILPGLTKCLAHRRCSINSYYFLNVMLYYYIDHISKQSVSKISKGNDSKISSHFFITYSLQFKVTKTGKTFRRKGLTGNYLCKMRQNRLQHNHTDSAGPPQGHHGDLRSQVAVSDVFSVHRGVVFPKGLCDTLTGLDVGLEDLCRFSIYSWRLNFIDVVL